MPRPTSTGSISWSAPRSLRVPLSLRVFAVILALGAAGAPASGTAGGDGELIRGDEARAEAFAAAIRAADYNCPRASFAYDEGEDVLGRVTKVYCRLAGDSKATARPALVFRIVLTPGHTILIGPWKQ